MWKSGEIAKETGVYACLECDDKIGVKKGQRFPTCLLSCCRYYKKTTTWYLTLIETYE